jgi:hypothetical protein
MKHYRLYQVDAFTHQKFCGNPAGVVSNAEGLTRAQMQAIAREMNCSETAFILPPQGPDHEVLILMVGMVLPPHVVFNAATYRLLLEIEAAQEEPHVLRNLTDEYNLSLEEILNKLLPSFSLSFMSPPAERKVSGGER